MTATQTAFDELRWAMRTGHLAPIWELDPDIIGLTPNPSTWPWLWRWHELDDIAERAGRLVAVEHGGDRQAIALANPGQEGLPYATSRLLAAVRWCGAQEIAPAHPDLTQAIRIIVDGAGSFSNIAGDKVFLEPGDLVLAPPWTWRERSEESDDPGICIDMLSIPRDEFLGASFPAAHRRGSPEICQAVEDPVRTACLRQKPPEWEDPRHHCPPMSTFKWADTQRALASLAHGETDPFDDVVLEFTHPTGAPVMKSFTCQVQMLRPQVRTHAHRHTGSSVYLAFEGHGVTVIDGVRFAWAQGDMFVVPSWATHEHHNSDCDARALLFSVHDTPLIKAMDGFRVQVHEHAHQEVVGDFDDIGLV